MHGQTTHIRRRVTENKREAQAENLLCGRRKLIVISPTVGENMQTATFAQVFGHLRLKYMNHLCMARQHILAAE